MVENQSRHEVHVNNHESVDTDWINLVKKSLFL